MKQENFVSGQQQLQFATLGGGCFWCLEAVFSQRRGVQKVVSGYCGGELPNPDYETVCSGTSGHAEVVQISFDPSEVSYAELLEVFFTIHDPTTFNRQGNDVGTQYRSVIFYHTSGQKDEAEKMIARLNAEAIWPQPIVTQILPLAEFYPAEAYHQEYFARHPAQPYCRAVVAPKLAKFRQKFAAKTK